MINRVSSHIGPKSVLSNQIAITPTPTSTPTPTVTSTSTLTPSLVTSNLIIQLDAYDTDSYSGTGTTVYDLVNNYDHTLTNAPYTVLNTIKCFDLNGVANSYIVVNGTGPTLPTSGYTYISWARIKNDTSTYRTLFRTSPNDHPLLIDINTNNLGFFDNDTNAFYSAGYSVSPIVDTWAQLTVVGDSTGSTFYVNSTLVGSTVKGAGGNRHNWWGLFGQPFGYVANMYYYNRKLSLSEITQQYNFLSPRFVEPTPTPTATSTPTATPTVTLTPTATPTPTPTPVTSNLVLYYDPSNSSSYSGSGTALNDLSGNGLNGTMSNITFTTPFFIYNGSTSQVTRLDNALLEPGSGDWTMEAWVNQTSAAGSQVILGKFDPGGGAQDVSYAIRIIGGNVRADFGNGSTAVSTANYTTTTGITYQLVYVFNNVANNNIITYVNGVQQATTTHGFGSILNTSAHLYLGSYNNNEYPQSFNGKIGITRLYNKALTSSEVLQNYNADKSKYGL